MNIKLNTKDNSLKVGTLSFNELSEDKKKSIIAHMKEFIHDNSNLDTYEEDSMWMSYRYCIGRHTIASHCRAREIAQMCYNRMSWERSVFMAYDMNREIENILSFGLGTPMFRFPVTSMNKIYTTAIDIFCQFLEDFNIKTKEELLNYYSVDVILTDNERGYKLEVVTWDDYICEQVHNLVEKHYGYKFKEDQAMEMYNIVISTDNKDHELYNEFKKITKNRVNPDYFYMSTIDDLLIWNDLIHLFDVEHHNHSILKDGTSAEWYWSYTNDIIQKEDGYYYQAPFGYRRIRRVISKGLLNDTSYIPDESILEESK